MTTDLLLSVFADFNEPKDEPAPPQAEDELLQLLEVDKVRVEAWTEGYLVGRQELADAGGDQNLSAKLLTSLHELDATTAIAVDSASLAVADLLVNTVIAVASEDWSEKLLSRVRLVAERIKPALTVAPEFLLRDDGGTEQRFGDITDLSHALEGGMIGCDVTIRWQNGQATISRTALLENLREAVIPLSAGLVNEQNARHVT